MSAVKRAFLAIASADVLAALREFNQRDAAFVEELNRQLGGNGLYDRKGLVVAHNVRVAAHAALDAAVGTLAREIAS